MKKIALALVLAAASVLPASASTLLLSFDYNGNSYSLWESAGISWDQAQAESVALGGNLATFTTEAETLAVYNAFIGNSFFNIYAGQGGQAWLGARPADGSSSTTDPLNWSWVTGEAWTAFDAANFAAGEPNGDSSGLAINRFGTSFWNDDTYVGGYIAEVSSQRVPDAASTLMLMLGTLAVFGAARRKLQQS